MEQSTVFAAIVGEPNVGKSTLINQLVGAKIAITANRPQTTRTRILGVITKGETQYVFTDTPGFHAPKNRLDEHMVKSVRNGYGEVDVILFTVFPKNGLDETETALYEEVKASGIPVILVLNKLDTVSSNIKSQKMIESICTTKDFDDTIAVSAATGKNIDSLFELLKRYAVEGPHYYDEDTLTDVPEKVICAEIIREKLLTELRDELPHGCAVSIEAFREDESGDRVDIDAVIMCEKKSHTGLIIGKGGSMLKKITALARKDIEEFLGCRAGLKCWVKVREGWRNNENYILDFGYGADS
ncbi:MAG: GTPase Era [Oscillospiraceae bacterium]|nr:GTPase Era [Oscillospiraceae bacterium]